MTHDEGNLYRSLSKVIDCYKYEYDTPDTPASGFERFLFGEEVNCWKDRPEKRREHITARMSRYFR